MATLFLVLAPCDWKLITVAFPTWELPELINYCLFWKYQPHRTLCSSQYSGYLWINITRNEYINMLQSGKDYMTMLESRNVCLLISILDPASPHHTLHTSPGKCMHITILDWY